MQGRNILPLMSIRAGEQGFFDFCCVGVAGWKLSPSKHRPVVFHWLFSWLKPCLVWSGHGVVEKGGIIDLFSGMEGFGVLKRVGDSFH